MKVLVTGASGVIGSAVVRDLNEAGYQVTAVSSADADLTDLDQTTQLLRRASPEGVIHLAARVHGLMGNVGHQGAIFFDNIRINTNLVEAARRVGVTKIVAMGSVAMYSDLVSVPMVETDLWVGPPHTSEYGYASAKRAMLAQLEAYKNEYGLEFAFALSTNLVGPNDRFDEAIGHVLPSLISKFHRGVLTGEPVVVWGTGSATRDFLYSTDAAAALRILLERGDGTYNLASGEHISIAEIVELLVDISGYQGEIEWDRAKPDGQRVREYDINKIRSLGWAPTLDIRTALRETYNWYVHNSSNVRR